MHDDLRLQNLAELPISTRRFATAAANGSWRDLRLLIERAGSNLRPRHVFPIFFVNLDPAGIPSVEQLDPDSPAYSPPCIPAVVISLQAMTTTRRELLKNYPMNQTCADIWPRAWRWIEFLHTYEDFLPDLHKFPGFDIYSLFVATIVDLQADPDTAALINATPGVHSVLARAWRIFLNPKCRLTDPGFRELCRLMFRGSNTSEPKNLAALMHGASSQDSLDELADLILAHIYRVHPGRENPISETTVFFLQGVVKILKETGTVDCPLHSALVAQGAVKAVTTVLYTYSKHGTKIPGTMDLLHDCFAILENLCRADNRRFAEALDAGLLSAIVLCGAGDFREVHVDVTRLLADLLPPTFVYHSLLSELESALGEVQRLAKLDSFTSSRVFKFWTPLVGLAEQRIAVMKKYDLGEYASLKVRGCDNKECSRPEVRSEVEFRQCCGCLVSVYCSDACQVEDWQKGEHREICRAIRSGRQREAEPQSTRDKYFLRALVNEEVETLKDKILFRQIQFLHKHPEEPFITYFDYKRGPVEMVVTSAKSIIDNPSRGILWANLARVSRIPGSCTPLIVTVASGSSLDFRHFIMRPTCNLRDGVERVLREIPEGEFATRAVYDKIGTLADDENKVILISL
ncbi:hypothetical protein C8R44DRAFT_856578 [Mycena epipterygia]|nr:hypothetical protein C8R44DRAFT_856578 [Mycena epipterygia]